MLVALVVHELLVEEKLLVTFVFEEVLGVHELLVVLEVLEIQVLLVVGDLPRANRHCKTRGAR